MELEYIKSLILIYQESPPWETLHPNRSTASLIKRRLVEGGLVERCKKTNGVRVPELDGQFLRLTESGTAIVLNCARHLPEDLKSEH